MKCIIAAAAAVAAGVIFSIIEFWASRDLDL